MENSKIILVLEDEKPLAEIIKKKLESNGFEVITARTAEQALEYLSELSKVDVLWVDHYLLGKETGLDFVAKIKGENSKWKKIPVFVVTNSASPNKVQSYLRFGITKYFAKTDHRLDEIVGDIKTFLGSDGQ